MKVNILTNKIFDNAEGENYTDNSSIARISLSGGDENNIGLTVVVCNDSGAKLGIAEINLKDGKIDVSVTDSDNRVSRLDNEKLDVLSDIFHDYKDMHRGDKEYLLSAMSIEKNLQILTGGRYESDTTYDWKESPKSKNKTRTYFQPVVYHDDGTAVGWGDTPEGLASFQAFATREDCEEWLENNGYDPGDYTILEYHDDDIEGVTIIDRDGNIIETNGED